MHEDAMDTSSGVVIVHCDTGRYVEPYCSMQHHWYFVRTLVVLAHTDYVALGRCTELIVDFTGQTNDGSHRQSGVVCPFQRWWTMPVKCG